MRKDKEKYCTFADTFNLFKCIDMKKRLIQFITTYFLFVCIFILQKPIFMAYVPPSFRKGLVGRMAIGNLARTSTRSLSGGIPDHPAGTTTDSKCVDKDEHAPKNP